MNNQSLVRIALILFILSVFFLVVIAAKDVLMPFAVSCFIADRSTHFSHSENYYAEL